MTIEALAPAYLWVKSLHLMAVMAWMASARVIVFMRIGLRRPRGAAGRASLRKAMAEVKRRDPRHA